MWRQRELAKLALAADTFGGRDYDQTCPRQNNPRRRFTYDGARECALQAQVYGARNLDRYPEFGRLPHSQQLVRRTARCRRRPVHRATAVCRRHFELTDVEAPSARVLTSSTTAGPY